MRNHLLFFSVLFFLFSCKKEKELSESEVKDTGYKSNPLANVLALEVQEDVNYAYEFNHKGSTIPLDSLPVSLGYGGFDAALNSYLMPVLIDNIWLTWFRLAMPGGYSRRFLDFSDSFYPDDYYFIPKDRLIHNPVKKSLDEANVKVIHERHQWEQGWNKTDYWKPIWDKVSDLAVVIQYRNAYPDSDVGFMTLENEYGVIKHYVFLAKAAN